MRNGEVSYWWQALGGFPPRRASLPGPLEADVCIVGGGYTGLWTAYYLAERRPDARIVVLEAAFAGYGASGRNGGWVTSELPGSRAIYARGPGGAAGVRALEAELRSTVNEVGRVCEAESIDCNYVRGRRELTVATSPTQLARLRAGLAHLREWGDGDDVYTFLSRDETSERINVAGALGRALRVGQRRGCRRPRWRRGSPRLRSGAASPSTRATPVTEILPVGSGDPDGGGAVARTMFGDVRARSVLRCTEGFTARLPGAGAGAAADEQLEVVTEPLPARRLEADRLGRLQTLSDEAHAYMYAQRTADGRIAMRPRASAVPVRFRDRPDGGHAAVDGRRARRGRAPDVSRRRRRAARARLVWRARRAARLVRLGQLRRAVRPRLGGRLLGPRGRRANLAAARSPTWWRERSRRSRPCRGWRIAAGPGSLGPGQVGGRARALRAVPAGRPVEAPADGTTGRGGQARVALGAALGRVGDVVSGIPHVGRAGLTGRADWCCGCDQRRRRAPRWRGCQPATPADNAHVLNGIQSLHERLDELQHVVAQRLEAAGMPATSLLHTRIEGGHPPQLPAWRRRTEGEARWQVALCTAVAIALQVAVPDRLVLLSPSWVLPALEGAMLICLIIANPHRINRESRALRMFSLMLAALISFANVWSLERLANGLVSGHQHWDAGPLLVTAARSG